MADLLAVSTYVLPRQISLQSHLVWSDFTGFLNIISHISTDGEKKNVGQHHGHSSSERVRYFNERVRNVSSD